MLGMKQKIVSASFAFALLSTPMFVSASAVDDIQSRIMHTLGAIAALQAQASSAPVTCALVASKSTVAAGEPFALIWNTFGAAEPANDSIMSQWARGGISTIRIDNPGTYRYELTFNGATGGEATCTTSITVRA
jgi:hypothetical protein